jgi:hypothetical protein
MFFTAFFQFDYDRLQTFLKDFIYLFLAGRIKAFRNGYQVTRSDEPGAKRSTHLPNSRISYGSQHTTVKVNLWNLIDSGCERPDPKDRVCAKDLRVPESVHFQSPRF